MSDRTCSIDNCGRPATARGWCGAHYQRWRNHGDPLGGGPTPKGAIDHPDGSRTCAKCSVRKPIDAYHADKANPLGRRTICKTCRDAHMKAWYSANRERQAGRQAARREADPERLRRQDRERYRRHREKRIALVEDIAHARRVAMKDGRWVRGITKRALRKRLGDECHYCGVTMIFTPMQGTDFQPDRASIEHLLPVSRGGAHDWDNVVLACWQCNLSKNARTVEEWAAQGGADAPGQRTAPHLDPAPAEAHQ